MVIAQIMSVEIVRSLSLTTLSITPTTAVEHVSEAQDDVLPPKLSNAHRLWSLQQLQRRRRQQILRYDRENHQVCGT